MKRLFRWRRARHPRGSDRGHLTAAAKPRALHQLAVQSVQHLARTTSRLLGSSTARGDAAREPSLSDTAEEVPPTLA